MCKTVPFLLLGLHLVCVSQVFERCASNPISFISPEIFVARFCRKP